MIVLMLVTFTVIFGLAWWIEHEISALYRRIIPMERRIKELEERSGRLSVP